MLEPAKGRVPLPLIQVNQDMKRIAPAGKRFDSKRIDLTMGLVRPIQSNQCVRDVGVSRNKARIGGQRGAVEIDGTRRVDVEQLIADLVQAFGVAWVDFEGVA